MDGGPGFDVVGVTVDFAHDTWAFGDFDDGGDDGEFVLEVGGGGAVDDGVAVDCADAVDFLEFPVRGVAVGADKSWRAIIFSAGVAVLDAEFAVGDAVPELLFVVGIDVWDGFFDSHY